MNWTRTTPDTEYFTPHYRATAGIFEIVVYEGFGVWYVYADRLWDNAPLLADDAEGAKAEVTKLLRTILTEALKATEPQQELTRAEQAEEAGRRG